MSVRERARKRERANERVCVCERERWREGGREGVRETSQGRQDHESDEKASVRLLAQYDAMQCGENAGMWELRGGKGGGGGGW